MRTSSFTLFIKAYKMQQRIKRLCFLAANSAPNTPARLMCALYFDYIIKHTKSGFNMTKLNHREPCAETPVILQAGEVVKQWTRGIS